MFQPGCAGLQHTVQVMFTSKVLIMLLLELMEFIDKQGLYYYPYILEI